MRLCFILFYFILFYYLLLWFDFLEKYVVVLK